MRRPTEDKKKTFYMLETMCTPEQKKNTPEQKKIYIYIITV